MKILLIQMLMTNSHSTATSKPHEIIFADGSDHFNALLQDIYGAKQSIDLETYIFNFDALGEKIANALCAAAKRGVTVRVMVDGAGSPLWTTNYAALLESSGAMTRVFHPFPWQLWNWSRSVVKAPLLLKWIFLFLKANYRNHRKVFIIDGEIAYIGSMNVSQCHLTIQDHGSNWRDTSVRISNTDLSELKRAFKAAWEHKPINERLKAAFQHVRRNPNIRVNDTRHRRRILYKQLLRRMGKCHHRIWITNAYFVPDNFLLRRLKDAAKRGVDVRILLPRKSDVMMMPWASTAFYFSLLKAGVRIFEYLPSVLHAKSLILDHWVLIGSSNLNHRSLLHDLEADVSINTLEGKKKMRELFLEDLKHSQEIHLLDWHKQRPLIERFLGRLVLYVKYFI